MRTFLPLLPHPSYEMHARSVDKYRNDRKDQERGQAHPDEGTERGNSISGVRKHARTVLSSSTLRSAELPLRAVREGSHLSVELLEDPPLRRGWPAAVRRQHDASVL